MLPAIGRSERRLLTVASAVLCTASVFLAPLAARSSIDVRAGEELAMRELNAPTLDAPPPPRGLAFARDPFAADTSPDSGEQAALAAAGAPHVPAEESIVGMSVQSGAPISGAWTPNRGADGTPLAAFGGTTISAVITGDKAQVLVSAAGRSQILGVGDRFDGHKIVRITNEGVRLDDGSTRSVSEGHQ